jgi:hypothetical protein
MCAACAMALPRIFGVLAAITACSTVPAKAPPAPPQAAVVAPPQTFPDAKSERVRSRSLDFPIELLLPARASWKLTDGPLWLEAEHAASSSKFAFRTWRAERLVRRSECESQARLERPAIPIAHDESVIDERPFAEPSGFDSELVVGAEPSALGVTGYAIVFGASVGRCYAAVFTTTTSGGNAEQEVAARLGIAVDRVLSSVRARSIDERAVRRRLVATPDAAR